MIIVSQDKETIVNFDNTQMLGLEEYEKTQIVCEGLFKIGEYKTEKRAKEVLQEIIKKYSSYLELKGGPAVLQGQIDIQPNIFNIPKVYEMPEE